MTSNRGEGLKSKIAEAKARGAWDEVITIKIAEAKDRGAKKRGWVVLRKTWLTSSINYRMALEEIAVFSKLIVMADEFGPVPGLISDNDLRSMPHEYLAHQAFCPLDVLESTLKKGIEDKSIYEDSRGIFLTHFDDYQFTEYDRQKPYREARKQSRIIKTMTPEEREAYFNDPARQKENELRAEANRAAKEKR